MFYVTIRLLGGGTPAWLHVYLSRVLAHRLPSVLTIAVAVLVGAVAFDETVSVQIEEFHLTKSRSAHLTFSIDW